MTSLKKYGPYLIFFAAMLWATDAPFRLHLTKDLPSNFIVLGEHFFDILIALPVLFLNWAELKKLDLRSWCAVLIIAFGGSALATVAFTEAFRYVNPSVAILLQKLQPFIAIYLAVAFLRERLPRHFWFWTLFAIAAAYVISFPDFVPRLYEGEVWNPNIVGISLALLAAALWGASTVLGRYALRSVRWQTITALRFVFAFVFLLGLNAYTGSISAMSAATSRDWLFIFIIAVTSGIVSLLMYYKGLENTKASVATVAELGFPFAAVAVNAVFIDAPITGVQIIGMVALLAAIYFLTRMDREDVVPVQTESRPDPRLRGDDRRG